jgi:hypothetical protein
VVELSNPVDISSMNSTLVGPTIISPAFQMSLVISNIMQAHGFMLGSLHVHCHIIS